MLVSLEGWYLLLSKYSSQHTSPKWDFLTSHHCAEHCLRFPFQDLVPGWDCSNEGREWRSLPPVAKVTFTYGGHTLGTSTLVAWRAAMSLVLSFCKIKDGSSLEASFWGEVPGLGLCPLLRDPLGGFSGRWKCLLTAATWSVWDSILDTHPLLGSSRPSIGNLSNYFRRLWIRFVLGNHAAEDQWLMNIHEKIHSVCLYLPTGMKYGLLCWRFSLDQKDLWRTYCTEYVLN